jgi:FlgD Ig-like domain
MVIGVMAFVSRQNHTELSSAPDIPMLGSSYASLSELSQLTSAFGHMPVVRVYYPGLPAAEAWSANGKAGANHSAVVVSFKALPNTILSGADDAALSHFFDTAPTDHPIYYSYYHEPEDNIAAGEFTLAGYKQAWAHVAALANAAHNPQLHSTLILMAYDLEKSSGREWKDYLPAGNIVTTLGWDAYPAGAVADKNPQLTPPATFMGPAVAASQSVGLPFGFAEFGVEDLPGRAAWLDSVGSYILNSGAVFGTLFKGAQMSDSSSISAWRGAISTAVAEIAAGTPAPTLTPTPPASTAPASTPSPSTPPSPAPSASPTATSGSPSSAGAWIAGLTSSPAELVGHGRVVIRFTLAQNSDVEVSIVGADGKAVREIPKPARRAGKITISYYGYDGHGHLLANGQYQIVVVASNTSGSSTAEIPLIISGR